MNENDGAQDLAAGIAGLEWAETGTMAEMGTQPDEGTASEQDGWIPVVKRGKKKRDKKRRS